MGRDIVLMDTQPLADSDEWNSFLDQVNSLCHCLLCIQFVDLEEEQCIPATKNSLVE